MSKINVDTWEPESGTAATLMASGDTVTLPNGAILAVASGGDINVASGGEIDIASGATLDVNGTIDLTGATKTGFPEGLFASYAIICDQKTAGTEGGTFTLGAWRTRDLNTEISDPDGIVSISTNEFTLAAGSYLIQWSAPAYEAAKNKTRLYDVTGTAVIQIGSSEFAWTGGDGSRSFGHARVTPSGSNNYRIEHQSELTKTLSGFGRECDFSAVEIFTIVTIYKES